jgi:hypothetical protein
MSYLFAQSTEISYPKIDLERRNSHPVSVLTLVMRNQVTFLWEGSAFIEGYSSMEYSRSKQVNSIHSTVFQTNGIQ